jgi:hypothetical protein
MSGEPMEELSLSEGTKTQLGLVKIPDEHAAGQGTTTQRNGGSEIVLKSSARQDSHERKLAQARPEKSMSADDGDSHRHKRNWDGKQSRILKTWTNGFAAPSNPCAVNVPRGSQSPEFFEVFEAPRDLPCELLLWVND